MLSHTEKKNGTGKKKLGITSSPHWVPYRFLTASARKDFMWQLFFVLWREINPSQLEWHKALLAAVRPKLKSFLTHFYH